MSEDLSKLTDRELSLLILQEVRGVARTLEGLAESTGRDVGQLKQSAETMERNIDLARNEVKNLSALVRREDFLAHDRVSELERRVETIESKLPPAAE